MPPGSGGDNEAFERYVYLQTAQRCKGDDDPDSRPPETFKVDLLGRRAWDPRGGRLSLIHI
eukprot:10087328-Alexandrium_andersonii.AAC.1